jgi:hypothetical protein
VSVFYELPRYLRRGFVVMTAFVALLTPQALFAQGCALCYTQAASSTQRFVQALRGGIIVLMVPPMFLSVMFTVMAYRRRKGSYDELLPEQESIGEDLL